MSGTVLGQGAYGLVTVRNGNAVKKFEHLSHLLQEYAALKYSRDCKYIVHTTGANFDNLELMMELHDCNMKTWLRNRDNRRPDKLPQIMKLLRDILHGLVELHDRDLVHGDLKPGNVLLKLKPLGAVLGDCGFVSISKYARSDKTTPTYCDPHIEKDSFHDMYSFGIILLEIVSGIKLTDRASSYEQINNIVNQKVKDTKYKRIISQLLSSERQNRPSARYLLKLLFNEEPPRWSKPKRVSFSSSNSGHNRPTTVVSEPKAKNPYIEFIMRDAYDKFKIRRANKGYAALLYYINEHNIGENDYKLYCHTTLLILASVFGSDPQRKYHIRYAIAAIGDGSNEQKCTMLIHQTLKDMLNDKIFVDLIFFPQKHSR